MRRYLNLIRHHRNWYVYLWYKFFTQRNAPLTLKTRGGHQIQIPLELVFTYKECFMDATYLKGFPQAVSLPKGAVVVDVGANVGYFSLFMQERFPGVEIHSYEPMPANYALLRTYHGQFSRLNWPIFNKAVSGAEGTLTLHDEEAEGIC